MNSFECTSFVAQQAGAKLAQSLPWYPVDTVQRDPEVFLSISKVDRSHMSFVYIVWDENGYHVFSCVAVCAVLRLDRSVSTSRYMALPAWSGLSTGGVPAAAS